MTTPTACPRLTHPLVRDAPNEPLRQASWEEALDRAAHGLESNRGAFGMFSSARATNETHYLAQKFARVVMGTHNIDSLDRARHAPSAAGLAAAFGSGGGTSSYEEAVHTDVIVMWGSDARSTHPVFFRHVLKAIRGGARLYVVDPRRTATAAWAKGWLGPDVGTDIPLAHAIGREIIHAGLVNRTFVERATSGFEDYRALVEPWTLSLAERVTGVPAAAIGELAHAFARAERAQQCWGHGVTGHRNGTDHVRALINLSLLTGQVGRYGCGLHPLSGRDNVHGGSDMGALPHRLPGFQDILDPCARRTFESAWGATVQPHRGLDLAEMSEAMEEGTLKALHCVGADPARSEADGDRAVRRLRSLDFLVVQDTHLTRTARLSDVALPAADACTETDGTTTSGERRVQRVRRALIPPGEAREHIASIRDLAARLGHDWKYRDSEAVWDELRSLSPDHSGMTYARLREHRGLQWPCPDSDRLEPPYLHGRLWEKDPARRGTRAPFGIVQHDPPAERVDARYPIRLGVAGRPDSCGGFNSGPEHGIELSPEDAERYEVVAGEEVRVSSRHASVLASVRIDTALRPGLAFVTARSPEEVDVDRAAVRIEKLPITTIIG
ncbi:molybdopterin oxidoreductase family protein [Streptomyces canus]|uniref:molybdopterin oxidoreductase family protein n=1 Tax=Streptomyces canus TaxID=58343 RepID=UPI00224EC2BB|nr:molybdopterin-dependent oxidoreductase [Streptomyces canus]MCX4855551.1 molybdopterin-dependent oxidoreductase [Streptomyces canus]